MKSFVISCVFLFPLIVSAASFQRVVEAPMDKDGVLIATKRVYGLIGVALDQKFKTDQKRRIIPLNDEVRSDLKTLQRRDKFCFEGSLLDDMKIFFVSKVIDCN